MSKSNGFAKSTEAVAELVADLVAVAEVKSVEAAAPPVMTVGKNVPEEPRKLSLEEKIQRVEEQIYGKQFIMQSRRKCYAVNQDITSQLYITTLHNNINIL